MLKSKKRLEEIKKRVEKATPGLWGPYSANIPFYAVVTKPAPSFSKHDNEKSDYWKIEDALLIANAVEDIKYLLKLLEEIEK